LTIRATSSRGSRRERVRVERVPDDQRLERVVGNAAGVVEQLPHAYRIWRPLRRSATPLAAGWTVWSSRTRRAHTFAEGQPITSALRSSVPCENGRLHSGSWWFHGKDVLGDPGGWHPCLRQDRRTPDLAIDSLRRPGRTALSAALPALADTEQFRPRRAHRISLLVRGPTARNGPR
jgi:hypothetical protein